MEQQTELQQILSMGVGDFLSSPNGEGELTEGFNAVVRASSAIVKFLTWSKI